MIKDHKSINGYSLSRAWFDFAFEKKECKVQHTALYMWIIELNNRLGWKEQFGLPTHDTMEGLSIGNKNTYYSALRDLNDWGFVTIVVESKNQYQATIIEICRSKSDTALTPALDTALIQHERQHCSGIDASIVPIVKPETNNKLTNKPKTISKETKNNSASPQTPKNIKLVRSTEDLKELARLSFENNNCIFENEFKKAWLKLLSEKKWSTKSQSAIDASLKNLMKYDEVFAQTLVENAIAGEYQGVTFPSTDNDYKKFKSNGITKNITTADKTQSRNNMVELARQILSSNATHQN